MENQNTFSFDYNPITGYAHLAYYQNGCCTRKRTFRKLSDCDFVKELRIHPDEAGLLHNKLQQAAQNPTRSNFVFRSCYLTPNQYQHYLVKYVSMYTDKKEQGCRIVAIITNAQMQFERRSVHDDLAKQIKNLPFTINPNIDVTQQVFEILYSTPGFSQGDNDNTCCSRQDLPG